MDAAPLGNFTQNTRTPFNTSSGSAVSLTGSSQAIVPTGSCPWFASDWFYPGRLLYIRHTFQTTSAATPGAFVTQLYFGNNTNGNGQLIVQTALTWTANLTGVTGYAEYWMRCWVTGSLGTLFGYGSLFLGGVGILPINWSGNGGAGIDTTQSGYMAPQYYRTGSTAETITHHDIVYKVMN